MYVFHVLCGNYVNTLHILCGNSNEKDWIFWVIVDFMLLKWNRGHTDASITYEISTSLLRSWQSSLHDSFSVNEYRHLSFLRICKHPQSEWHLTLGLFFSRRGDRHRFFFSYLSTIIRFHVSEIIKHQLFHVSEITKHRISHVSEIITSAKIVCFRELTYKSYDFFHGI